ncbi:YutD family protein [Mycoplasmatota bacterium]|nr:YutD family protein [Mycoplasmatota bacterium]
MIETEHGMFELVKNYRESFVLDDFNQRYTDYFDKYKYIVGDYSAGLLRLKGFVDANHELIPDYIVESCAPNCAYYILKNVSNNKIKEEKKE